MATKGKGTSGKRGSTSKPPKRTHSTRHAEAQVREGLPRDEEAMTPAELIQMIDVVPVGVCVTFPDGTVIDRRPLSATTVAALTGPVPSGCGSGVPLGPTFPTSQWGTHHHDRTYT